MNKKIALFLALVLASANLLVACGESEIETTSDTTTVDTINTETEYDPYAGYDFGGKSLRVLSSADEFDSTNAHFLIAGSGELTGEIVNDAVYARNLKVEEGLNTDIEYTASDWTYSDIIAGIDQLIMAGDSVYDVIINDIFRLMEASIKGQLHNVAKTDKLTLDADWWYTDAMEDLVIVPGAMYAMLGDYFADSLASVHVIYYNKDVILDNYGDENYLHDIIMEGDFTNDVMLKIMETCARDLDGNGKFDHHDLVGNVVTSNWGPSMPTIAGFNMTYINRDDPNNIYYDFNNEHSVAALEAAVAVSYSPYSLRDMTSVGDDWQEGIRTMLANGQCVFAEYLRLSDFGKMRDFDTSIGLSPYPKLNEEQENYVSSLHDTSEVGAVLLTTPVDDLDFVFTCLDFLGKESAETVIPTWFEEALKVKYSSGEEDAVILDLIRSTIDKPFAVAFQSALGYYPLANCFLYPILNNSTDFASAYQKSKSAGEAALASAIASYQTNLANGN